MANFFFTAQDVNGDPLVSGGNINITANSFTDLEFVDVDDLLGIAQTGEYVLVNGGTTQLSYEFLGYGDVRGDPNQLAGFIRIDNGDGTFTTLAIDMNVDGDRQPNLQNGNTKLTVAGLDTTTSNPFPPPPCFAEGSLIETNTGEIAVEHLRLGDMVLTMDDGFQPVTWIGHSRVDGMGEHAPVVFEPGAIGNDRRLCVSPQHRIMIQGWAAELLCGQPEVLATAKHLINGTTIRRAPTPRVSYFHLLLPSHHLVRSHGCWTESFFPGDAILSGNRRLRAELNRKISGSRSYATTVRPAVSKFLARVLARPAEMAA